ncbi:MAG: hypothetical protein ACTHMS_21380 [Jatrophihabitans sp.]|uniref:hypothetical protein n=1 Tax=Jatrophihabitans sp. TaxID=1932789 RepID=UPI003F7EBE1E
MSADRLDNGLQAATYVPLTDVDPAIGEHLLSALGRARIAAYLDVQPAAPLRRLFVASDDRGDARTIVAAAVRALGSPEPPPVTSDPLAGVDTDAAFAAIVADWHVDTVNAIREAERELTKQDADWREQLAQPTAPSDEPVWLDDDHYVPPPPPPLPRFAAPTIMALAILVVSIMVLGLGGEIGLANQLSWILGVGGVLLGAGILVSRLREHRDEDDDGSAV